VNALISTGVVAAAVIIVWLGVRERREAFQDGS
jgi:hypothetical protein